MPVSCLCCITRPRDKKTLRSVIVEECMEAVKVFDKKDVLLDLEILFFSSRVAKGESVQLPVTAEFRLPKAG